MRIAYHEKMASEVHGTTYLDQQIDRLEGLKVVASTWIDAQRKGTACDIVYVAKLQRKMRGLERKIDGPRRINKK